MVHDPLSGMRHHQRKHLRFDVLEKFYPHLVTAVRIRGRDSLSLGFSDRDTMELPQVCSELACNLLLSCLVKLEYVVSLQRTAWNKRAGHEVGRSVHYFRD